ncbi:MAG: heme NO-binding domain-containing protein [Marinosulfonomonas sp.]|nr:heme NO-binding domain-containing protein [Marinosulfonomonas sp.]
MYGLINRSIQCFICDTYGPDSWKTITGLAGLGFENFEAMMSYDDELTGAVLSGATSHLSKPTESILEDLGTYLASHPNLEGVRRLLRFGGDSFLEFLHSLDDMPGAARLAAPDLILPQLETRDHLGGVFTLYCRFPVPGSGHVMVGILRAMADDYGTLALLEHLGGNSGVETVKIQLLETQFAAGRSFQLSSAGPAA